MTDVRTVQAGGIQLAYREWGPPGGQLITIPTGHLVHAVQPARFISAVTAFLADDASAMDPPA